MKISSVLPICLSCFILFNLSVADEDKVSVPAVTEIWEPKVQKIESPQKGIPSDAIHLFDGTHLDEWVLTNPEANEWIIENGAMKVPPRKQVGDKEIASPIRTKKAFGDD